MTEYRTESDMLGEVKIPATAYWGVHTARAVENFPISGTAMSHHADLVRALAAVKQAAARANSDVGALDSSVAAAIDSACQEVRDGELHDQFVVDVVQGGAGTSSNINANEVIANRALELLGHNRGEYHVVDPLDHVNHGQSTNDVYPTALQLATISALQRLDAAIGRLRASLAEKSTEFRDLVKVGRTQLQDAVPMTVGQEFGAWDAALGEEQSRIADMYGLLDRINLGGTAIGTGLNAAPGYTRAVRAHLSTITGRELTTAADLIAATSDAGVFVQASATLKRAAVKISKLCNDLRLLSSGPQSGVAELQLPARQAGSSIMPAKVNPVIPEVVNQVAFSVMGGDVTISAAAEAGQLQLNAFEPIIAHTLLTNIDWMSQALGTLTDNCISGIRVNSGHLAELTERSVAIITALTPQIGHATASRIAQQALQHGRNVRELVREEGVLDDEQLEALTQPDRLTGQGPPA